MANQHINVYKNNPTAGGKDGTLVSSDGSHTSPIRLMLAKLDSQSIKLAIRTEQGYKTTGETIIKIYDPKNKTHLSWDDTLDEYTEEISTTEPITDTNKIFYLLANSYGLPTGNGEGEDTSDTYMSLQVLYKMMEG